MDEQVVNSEAVEVDPNAPELPSEEALQEASAADEIAEFRERFEREMADLRAQNQATEQRLRDTQAWANQRHMAALAAETAQQVVRANQPRPEPPRPPRLSAEEKEAIYTDPDLLERLVEEKIT